MSTCFHCPSLAHTNIIEHDLPNKPPLTAAVKVLWLWGQSIYFYMFSLTETRWQERCKTELAKQMKSRFLSHSQNKPHINSAYLEIEFHVEIYIWPPTNQKTTATTSRPRSLLPLLLGSAFHGIQCIVNTNHLLSMLRRIDKNKFDAGGRKRLIVLVNFEVVVVLDGLQTLR